MTRLKPIDPRPMLLAPGLLIREHSYYKCSTCSIGGLWWFATSSETDMDVIVMAGPWSCQTLAQVRPDLERVLARLGTDERSKSLRRKIALEINFPSGFS